MSCLVSVCVLVVFFFGSTSAAALGDTCQVGMYNAGDDANVQCKPCTTAPLGSYYTSNGNKKDACTVAKCSSLTVPVGGFAASCGFDANNIFSICGSLPADSYDKTCHGTITQCDIVAKAYTDIGSGNTINSCNSYCSQQGLDCDGGWEGNKCPLARNADQSVFARSAGCSAKFKGFPKQTGVCRCKLKPVQSLFSPCKDINSVCFLLKGNCPAGPASKTALPQADVPRRLAASQCRKTCKLCDPQNIVFDGSLVLRATNAQTLKPGERFTGPGDPITGIAPIAKCTDKCAAGELNAGCAQEDGTSMTKTFKHALTPLGAYTIAANYKDQDTQGCSMCASSCQKGQYLTGSCDGKGFSDTTECKECKDCGENKFQARSCSGKGTSDNTICADCTTSCAPGFYLNGKKCDGTAATTTSQVKCETCFPNGCPDLTFRDLRVFGGCSGKGTSKVERCRSCKLYCANSMAELTYPGCTQECYRTIIAGYQNKAVGFYDAARGGYRNTAGAMPKDTSAYNLVIGGGENRAHGKHKKYGATVGGGQLNKAGGASSFVGGGEENMGGDIDMDYSTDTQDSVSVLGGYGNLAYQAGATIVGGRINTVMDDMGVVWGGYKNKCTFELCSIVGGYMNTVSNGGWSTIMGGTRNVVSTKFGTVMGGAKNTVSARFGTVLGGSKNKVTGRWGVAAGWMSQALDDRSVAMQFYKAAGSKYCRSKKSGSMILCTEAFYLQSTEPKRDLVLYTCCYGYLRYKKVICPKKTPGFPVVGLQAGTQYKTVNEYWSKSCKATFYGMNDEWDNYWDADGNLKLRRRLIEETGQDLPPEMEDIEFGPHEDYAKTLDGAVLLPKSLAHMAEANAKHMVTVDDKLSRMQNRVSALSGLVEQLKNL